MIVTVYGRQYHCTRAVKGANFVRLYDEQENVAHEFLGISDFAGYEISGGTWETPQPTRDERLDALEAAMLEMILGGAN